ncbi:MAG: phosphate acetyltransferase [Deltaproteobacteria bacterium]|nr:phosphate acetyltransferase [Deltaproteobacteria bacterium]
MAKSLYIAAVGQVNGKNEAVLAVLGKAPKQSTAYFKPVAQGPDDPGVKAAMAAAGLSGAPADYYGLTRKEVFDLLAKGQTSAILDAVFQKYNPLAGRFDTVVIEGLDLEPSGGALANLDADIAANLGSPALLLAETGKGDGSADAAALAVSAYQQRFVQVMALAVIGGGDEPALPEGVNVRAFASPADMAGCPCLDKAGEFLSRPGPRPVTPKAFEFQLIEKAKLKKQHIVLPEGNDERILRAADDILVKDFADITILGDPDAISGKAKELGLGTLIAKAQLVNPLNSPLLPDLTREFYELRKAKGLTEEKAAAQMQDRNFFATMMVKLKKADGMVSGADGTTADTIRPALMIIKTKPGCSIASSVFLMCLADRVWVFGDCAINPNPNPQQLAEIAIISAQTAKAFGVDPKVALLSYSTGASGTGPDVDAVTEATKLAREAAEKLYPGLPIDGPLQFDAAVDPKTGKSKMPGSPVAGQATVMVFPSLSAGNIGYKAVQRTANAVAIGPVIQGLNAPVNDLSRGCLVADIINTVAITALQAMAEK